MKNIIHHFINLLYPNLCLICGDNLVADERQICTKCFYKIPKTSYHTQKDNEVEERFWGKTPINRATSYFYFQKGSNYQKLIHELKYRGNKEIGELLGKYAGFDLLKSADFRSIDLLVPVPLHRNKERARGYNQSEIICKGLAEVMNKAISSHNLYRKRDNTTQTNKSVYERYENVQDVFDVKNPSEFKNKHLLLVDDVLTTGSTLEGCAQALIKHCNPVQISIFTLALAQ